MPRPAPDPAIGPALEAARAETPPVRWKVLEARFGLTRMQLHRILLQHQAKCWEEVGGVRLPAAPGI